MCVRFRTRSQLGLQTHASPSPSVWSEESTSSPSRSAFCSIHRSMASRSCGPVIRCAMSVSTWVRTSFEMMAGRWLMSVTPSPRARPFLTRSLMAPDSRSAPCSARCGTQVSHSSSMTCSASRVVVEPLGEVDHEPALRALAEEAQVEHHRLPVLDDEVGDDDAARLFERDVGVLAAEDDDGEPRTFTVPRVAQSPDDPYRVERMTTGSPCLMSCSVSTPAVLVLCVGIIDRPARYSLLGESTAMQRIGTDDTRSTATIMRRVLRDACAE